MDKEIEQKLKPGKNKALDAIIEHINKFMAKIAIADPSEQKMAVRYLIELAKMSESGAASAYHPILGLVLHAAVYGDYHRQMYGSDVAEDRVLGDAIQDILAGIRILLNGNLAGLDGGHTDALILAVGEALGYEPDDL